MTTAVPTPEATTPTSISTSDYVSAKDVAEQEHISSRVARRWLRRTFGAGNKLFDCKPELWPAAVVRERIKREKARLNGGWHHGDD